MSAQTQTITKIEKTEEHLRTKGLSQRALYRLSRDPLTLVALGVLILIALLALFAPVISEQILRVDYEEINLRNNYAPIGAPGHFLGTDEMGRDHLARLLYAGRVSLSIGFLASILSLAIGVSIGVITGFYGGFIDDVFIWFITTLNSVPSLFLLLMVAALLSPSPTSLILVLAFLGWTGTARIVSGGAFELREREFSIAARAVGASNLRIMFVHIVPNLFSVLIVDLATGIGALILTESALSFLGFGVSISTPTWGNMLSGGLDLIRRAPHLIVAPGLLITVTVLCLYVIGDGLRDAFDPRIAD
jgi:peptide/nickel transport system permease protein